MKKIIIVHHNMVVGGMEKSLIELLKIMSKNKNCDVTLLLFKKQGAFLDQIPENIKILESKKLMQVFGVCQKDAKKYGKLFAIKRTVSAIFCRLITNKLPIKIALSQQKKLYGYDIAISYTHDGLPRATNVGCQDFVLNKIEAKKKIVFVHADFKKGQLDCRNNVEKDQKFDKIICVSQSCARQVKELHPNLANKVDYLYNFIDKNDIIKKSSQINPNYDSTKINLVTVSRLTKEKGILDIFEIVKELKQINKNFCWHVVGDGILLEQLRSRINEENMQDCVKLYGIQINPYPYVKNADLFVFASHHESFGIVLVESLILKTPVLCLNTISAKEIVGENGIVCDTLQVFKTKLEELIKDRYKIEKQKLITQKFNLYDEYNKEKLVKLLEL